MDRLAEAGAAWAAQDTHPWQLFAMKLHEMFLGVLRDRKGADDEAGSLFPTSHRKEPHNTYPWHLLQLPQPQGVPTPPPRTGGHAERMATGPRPPTHGNPVDDGATVADDAAYGAPTAAGPLAGLVHGAGSGFSSVCRTAAAASTTITIRGGGNAPLGESQSAQAHHHAHGKGRGIGHYLAGQDNQPLQDPNPYGSRIGHGAGGKGLFH